MPNHTIERLSAQVTEQQDFIDTLLEQVESEGRDLVDAERRNLEAAEQRLSELQDQLKPLKDYEDRKAAAQQLVTAATRAPAMAEPRPAAPETRSLGEIFAESEQLQRFAQTGRGTMDSVYVPEFRAVGPDPLLTTTAPGSDMLRPATKVIQQLRRTPYPLLDYVGSVEVGSNAVSWVVTSEATGADVVQEGKKKPPIVWTAAETTYTLQMVAGWFKASRQAIQDIPQLRSIIDQKLRQAIDKKLNELALAALGAGVSSGNTVTGASGAEMVAVVREAIADLEAAGVNPNAVFVNPKDAAAFDVAMLGKPLGVAQINGGMWGLPIVPVPGVTEGEAYVGDWSEALIWFYRTGLMMYATDSDISDGDPVVSDFRSNILTYLGEVRGVFGAVDGTAFRKVATTA